MALVPRLATCCRYQAQQNTRFYILANKIPDKLNNNYDYHKLNTL